MKAKANGVEIEHEILGDEDAPVVLLIMSLGGQLTSWPMPLIHDLVTRGYRPIRYDRPALTAAVIAARSGGKASSILVDSPTSRWSSVSDYLSAVVARLVSRPILSRVAPSRGGSHCPMPACWTRPDLADVRLCQ